MIGFMANNMIKLTFFFILQICVSFTPALAQTVTVQSGEAFGQGFLIRENGQCYLVLPKHVAGGRRRVTVFSAAPVVHSTAYIETPFWDGMDLAIGTIRGEVGKRCTRSLDDFANRAAPESGKNVDLMRIRKSGEIERVPMRIIRSDYLTFDAEIAAPGAELFKGTSGAFLFDGDKPVGMIVDALSATEGRFIRIEEIHQNLARRLGRRAGFSAPAAPPETNAQVDGLSFEFVRATLPPVRSNLNEANMLGAGSYVFGPTRPNRIAFRIAGPDAVALRRVIVRSDPEGDFALPRGIRIEVSSQTDGTRPRAFLSGEMPPDGVFDHARAASLVRWVFLTVTSAWDPGPIGIGSVQFQ